jgi:hypothetical protein
MGWKLLPGLLVDADVEPGRREQVLALEYDVATHAIRVAWPPVDAAIPPGQAAKDQPVVAVAAGDYEPLDATAWEHWTVP